MAKSDPRRQAGKKIGPERVGLVRTVGAEDGPFGSRCRLSAVSLLFGDAQQGLCVLIAGNQLQNGLHFALDRAPFADRGRLAVYPLYYIHHPAVGPPVLSPFE